MKAKYVVVEYLGDEVPLIFPEHVLHCSVAVGSVVKSAGFVMIGAHHGELTVNCFGRSTLLDVDSRPLEDAGLIKRMLADKQPS